MKTTSREQQVWVPVRRASPTRLAVYIGNQKVLMAPRFARDLAGKLLRGAARLDPNFRDQS